MKTLSLIRKFTLAIILLLIAVTACKKTKPVPEEEPDPDPPVLGNSWAISIGSNCSVKLMKADSMGNVYIFGQFEGTADMDPGPGVTNISPAGSNNFLAKYDKGAKLVYAKALDLTGIAPVDMAVDNIGNVFLAGTFTETVNFNAASGTSTLTSLGQTDGFLAKYGTTGQCLLVHRFGGTNFDGIWSVKTDESNMVYIGGTVYGSTDIDPGPAILTLANARPFLAKFNNNAELVFANGLSSAGEPIELGMNAEGNVFAGGIFQKLYEEEGEDPVYISYSGILKFNNTGVKLMDINLDDEGEIFVTNMLTDHLGNIWATLFTDTENGILVKYDSAGDFLFRGNLADHYTSYDLAADSHNRIYVSGFADGEFGIDLSDTNGPEDPDNDGRYKFVVKLNNSGKAILFRETMQPSYFAANSNYFYMAGSLEDREDFDLFSGETAGNEIGVKSIYLVKIADE